MFLQLWDSFASAAMAPGENAQVVGPNLALKFNAFLGNNVISDISFLFLLLLYINIVLLILLGSGKMKFITQIDFVCMCIMSNYKDY